MLLTLDRVSAAYGRSRVLWDVDLAVPDGGALALVGRNGVGKTTLLKTIVGIQKSISGRISFGGIEITTAAPHLRARAGIGFVPQGRHVFPQLTVAENLATGLAALDGRPEPDRRVPDYVFDMFPKLATIASRKAGFLSGGEQQQLAIGRALAGQPKLLLLDEPTAGMGEHETDEMVAMIRRLHAERDLTILFIEHDMDIVFNVAQRITVLDYGRVLACGTPEQIAADPRVQAAYLGGEA